jgi:phosphate transport system permease protein
MTGISRFRSFGIAASAVMLAAALGLLLLVLLPWYGALAAIGVLTGGAVVLWRRMSADSRRSVSENIFILLSGATAVAIVVFVLYFITHIFLLGKGNLSWSFLVSPPAEGLTKGGIMPAIVGTALLVIIMSLAAVPIGTITAIYLSEYARHDSVIARSIRFAVNTLAGVPAIVFGLFGLGFFIGTVGRMMDQQVLERHMSQLDAVFALPASPFAGDGAATADEVRTLLRRDDAAGWAEQIEQLNVLAEIHGTDRSIPVQTVRQFFRDQVRPRWGQPSLLWAALTMALLTLPVVIVSVEEAIKTVPRDLREASLALGATKWKTIRSIVIPGAMTGILTGGILAVSRGAGEVAPILFTGAAYYLPELPRALSSQFMELGYHIYVLTTQSPDVEATKPLLYSTTFVLLFLTFALNFTAIFLRSRVRARMK